MSKKLIIPYHDAKDLGALLATLAVADDVEDITIVRLISADEATDPNLLVELKGVSASAQRLPHCRVETRRKLTA